MTSHKNVSKDFKRLLGCGFKGNMSWHSSPFTQPFAPVAHLALVSTFIAPSRTDPGQLLNLPLRSRWVYPLEWSGTPWQEPSGNVKAGDLLCCHHLLLLGSFVLQAVIHYLTPEPASSLLACPLLSYEMGKKRREGTKWQICSYPPLFRSTLSWDEGFERLKTLWMPPGFLSAGPFPCSPVWFFKLVWQRVQAVRPLLWKRNYTVNLGNN